MSKALSNSKKYLILGVAAVMFASACEAPSEDIETDQAETVETDAETSSSELSTSSSADLSTTSEVVEEDETEQEQSAADGNKTAESSAPTAAPTTAVPATAAPTTEAPTTETQGEERAASPAPTSPRPSSYSEISSFGVFHGSSSHTHDNSLQGGRTAITTEALVTYSNLRSFLGREEVGLETIGQWAFDNSLTNNDQAYDQDLKGAGLYIATQGAKVAWIRDDAFDPQIIADIQRIAREGKTDEVMAMVDTHGHSGYGDHLRQTDMVDTFVNTLKMEPHYGGWMHGRMHGGMPFLDGSGGVIARSHDVNHLTVLSHDQTQPFMNDTFDWPQWPALEVPESDVIDYFQSMVVLGNPTGNALP